MHRHTPYIRPLRGFGDERIFEPELCLITTMECGRHERLLHAMQSLFKDIEADVFITEQDVEDLLAQQMSRPYSPNDEPVNNVGTDRSVGGTGFPLEQMDSKPLQRVRPLQRHRSTDPGSPYQLFMSNSYFRAMSNPCVCIPNLPERLMKFDKQIKSFLHKTDLISKKMVDLLPVSNQTGISMKPFARFIHSVNTTSDFLGHLLDITRYKGNSSQISEVGEDVAEIERGMTLGRSFLTSETLDCRCCSNCVWLIRMFCGSSLRKFQTLKRQTVQQRAQLMKVNSRFETTADPTLKNEETKAAQPQRYPQESLKPPRNTTPDTASSVHDNYRMYPQLETPLPVSLPSNQPWYPSLSGNKMMHPPLLPSNQPRWPPPMVSPAAPCGGRMDAMPTLSTHRLPLVNPASKGPVIARGLDLGRQCLASRDEDARGLDLGRQCLASREEDPLGILSSDMNRVGLPFGGNCTEDQDYRDSPSSDHQKFRHSGSPGDLDHRPFDRRPVRGVGHRRYNQRFQRKPLPDTVTTHYIMQSFPEVEIRSAPSCSSPLMSSSPQTNLSLLGQSGSPFYKARSRPVGQEKTFIEPSLEFPSYRPPWIHTDFPSQSSTQHQGSPIPSISNPRQPEDVNPVKAAFVGKDSILLSPPASEQADGVPSSYNLTSPSLTTALPRDMAADSKLSSDMMPHPLSVAKVTDSNPMTPSPPVTMVTDYNQLLFDTATNSKVSSLPSIVTEPLQFPSSKPKTEVSKEREPRSPANEINRVIDETVNAKSCSTFSFKSFNPVHKARKFMTKCKELTSWKRQLKLDHEGMVPWQQEDGFQWRELDKKSPSTSSIRTSKKTSQKDLQMVEQTKSRSSEPKTAGPTPYTSKTTYTRKSSKSPKSPRLTQTNARKERSPKTPSSPRMKKSLEVGSPKTPMSPHEMKTSVYSCPPQFSSPVMKKSSSPKTPVSSGKKKTKNRNSPKTPSTPRVKKPATGKSPKTRSSPRVKPSECKSPKGSSSSATRSFACPEGVKTEVSTSASLSGSPVMVDSKSSNQLTHSETSLPQPSILTPKPSKPHSKPPSRQDIERHIHLVKNRRSPKSQPSSAVLKLPLKCPTAESSCTAVSTSVSCIEKPVTSLVSSGGTSVQSKLLTVSSGNRQVTSLSSSIGPITMPNLVPVCISVRPVASPVLSTGPVTISRLVPAYTSERPITSLVSSVGPAAMTNLVKVSVSKTTVASPAVRPVTMPLLTERPVLVTKNGVPVLLSVPPTVSMVKNVHVVSQSPVITTSTVNHSQTSTPKLHKSAVHSSPKVQMIPPKPPKPARHDLPPATSLLPDRQNRQTALPEIPAGQSSAQLHPSQVSLLNPRVMMRITKNTDIPNTYHVSSIQTTAGTTPIPLADLKCEQRSLVGSTDPTVSVSKASMNFAVAKETSKSGNSEGSETFTRAVPVVKSRTSVDTRASKATSEYTLPHATASDSGSSTPDRLIIVTDTDDESFVSEQKRPTITTSVTSCMSQATDVQHKQTTVSHTSTSTLTCSLVSSADPSPRQVRLTSIPRTTTSHLGEQGHQQQPNIPQISVNTKMEKYFESITSAEKSNDAPDTDTLDVTPVKTATLTKSKSSSRCSPGWIPIKLPSYSQEVPSQETRNKIFQYRKFSSASQPSASSGKHWKDRMAESTMVDIMLSTRGYQRLDSHKPQGTDLKPVTDVRKVEKWSDSHTDSITTKEHRCFNSVQEILTEETLKNDQTPTSRKVQISRKRLISDSFDDNWIIQDKEYNENPTENQPKRRRWLGSVQGTQHTTKPPEFKIQPTGENQGHVVKKTFVSVDTYKKTTQCTTQVTVGEDRPARVVIKPETAYMEDNPYQLPARYGPLRKLKSIPPIAFQGKINEQRVREVLSDPCAFMMDVYDHQRCRILPKTIQKASSNGSPRYFARELIFMIFTIGELQGKKIDSNNPRSRLTQSQILNPTMIAAVKDVVLHTFLIEEFHWYDRCIPFINDSLKSLFQKKLAHPAFRWIEGIESCFYAGAAPER